MNLQKGTHKYLLSFLLLFLFSGLSAQNGDTSEVNIKRLSGVIALETVGYTGTMIALNEAWYKDYPRSSFHFFNDNDEWLQVDKAGHFVTSYHISKAGKAALSWSGVEDDNAVWYGGGLGFLFLTSIEVYDGFSQKWGASIGDAIANAGGTGLYIGQHYLWGEQRITPKYSFHTTQYPELRPGLLGQNLPQQLIKDYNGQTYWLSLNINSFINGESDFPKWINIAFGYGGEGMAGAKNSVCENYDCIGNGGKPELEFYKPVRQYYFSLDIDLSRIKTRSRFLNSFLSAVNFIKIPFPALEYNNKQGLVFQPLYF